MLIAHYRFQLIERRKRFVKIGDRPGEWHSHSR
jgi:hypothetical protein